MAPPAFYPPTRLAIQRTVAPSVVEDLYYDAYQQRMAFRPSSDVAGYRQGINQVWTNAFFALENALTQYRTTGELAPVLPHFYTLRNLGAPTRTVSPHETQARAVLADMNNQYGMWDGTLQNRGAYWGAANPGSAVGAQSVSARVTEYLRSLVGPAWEFSNSVSSGASFKRVGTNPTFIYHLAPPAS